MSCEPASLLVPDGLGSSCCERYFDVPFACFQIVAMWDEQRNLWQVTDNGLAVASWLTSYDQWPPNWDAIIGGCGVSCCQEEFYAFGQQADEAARRLIVALLYLEQVRRLKVAY